MTAPDAKAFLFFDDDDEDEVSTEAQIYDRTVVGRTYDRRPVYVDPQTLNLPTAEEVGPCYGVAPLQGDIPTSDQSPAVIGNEPADN